MKKRHPAAVREWAIQQIMLPIGRSMTEVASELGVTTEALRLWRKAFLSQLNPDGNTRHRAPLPQNVRPAPQAQASPVGKQSGQIRYTPAFREWAVAQMMPPFHQTAVEL